MINTERLNAYLKRARLNWKEIAEDVGGIPADLQTFIETFDDEASADTVAVLISALRIPATEVGPIFFARATYDENTQLWSPAAPDNVDDELHEVMLTLSTRQRHDVLSLAYKLQGQGATA